MSCKRLYHTRPILISPNSLRQPLAGKAKGMDVGYKGGTMGGYNGYKGGGCAYGYATDAYQKGKSKRDSFDGGFSGKGGRDYPTHGTGAAATQENIDM